MERTQRTITRLFAITALVAAFATSFAQGGFGGPPQGGPGGQQGGRQGGPGGPGQQMRAPRGPQLLRHPDVQKELKLSDSQMKAIDQAFPQMGGGQGGPGGPGGQGGFGGGQAGPGGQRGGGQGGPGGAGGQGGPGRQGGGPNPQVEAKIKEILTPVQFTRFKQIELQIAGPQAFMMPEVAERLQISEEQHEAIREVMESMRPPQGQPGQQGGQGGQRPDPAKRMKEVMSKVLAVLSDKQRAEYRTMTGKEFTLSMQPMGGQRGPGNRQGGQGGPGGPPPPDGN